MPMHHGRDCRRPTDPDTFREDCIAATLDMNDTALANAFTSRHPAVRQLDELLDHLSPAERADVNDAVELPDGRLNLWRNVNGSIG